MMWFSGNKRMAATRKKTRKERVDCYGQTVHWHTTGVHKVVILLIVTLARTIIFTADARKG